MATPAAMPVEIHASASVSRFWSTEDCVTATEAIKVGAMAIPLSVRSSARTTGCPTNGSGSKDSASRDAPTRKRLAGEARHVIAPLTAPATRDPNAQAIKIRPAYLSTPASFANATTLTSMPPNTMPRAAEAMATGSRTRHGNRDDPALPSRDVGRIGGWLLRWTARAMAPMRPMTALTLTPSAG